MADPCGSGALTTASLHVVHRAPFLQNATASAVTVAWAGMPDGQHVALAREDADGERRVIARVPGAHPAPEVAREQRAYLYDELHEDYDDDENHDEVDDEVEDPLEAEDYYELAARITGLEPGVRYCYRLETDHASLTDWASLRLAPRSDPDRVDRFVILGDSGTGGPAQLALARRIAPIPMDAILFLGDIAYPSGTHEELRARFFDVYSHIFRRVPVYAAIGNHDVRSQGGKPFEEALLLPGTERWYSFDLGDVHFVVLDTTRIGRAQAAWLERDLAASAREFTVVLAHHPPYTSSQRGGSHGFRKWFVPVLERHDVELVLTGHEHHYERLKPIGSIVYVVSGGGGASLHRARSSSQTARLALSHHFLVVEAHSDRLRVRAINIDGGVIDAFESESRSQRRRAGLRRSGTSVPGP
jgi:hypothetical protein